MITSTKRKAINREMAGHSGMVLVAQLQKMASRYHLGHDELRLYLNSMGFAVERPPPPALTQPKPSQQAPAVSPEVVTGILRGSIYKVLGDVQGEDPSTVFVVTTLDKWRRERQAIRQLMGVRE